MSVDVWCQKTIAKSRMVIVRCLGGESYWPYGLEALHATCVNSDVALAVLPGDDKPDPSLERFNTVPVEVRLALWDLLVQGGVGQCGGSLLAFRRNPVWRVNDRICRRPRRLLKGRAVVAGEGAALAGDDVRKDWIADAPVCAISFYRALVQSGNTEPVVALIDALKEGRSQRASGFRCLAERRRLAGHRAGNVLQGRSARCCDQHDRLCRFVTGW